MLRVNKWLLVISIICGLTFSGIINYSYAAGNYKIGYVDLSKIFDTYEETKEADKILEKKGSEKQAQRDKMVDEVKKLKDEVEMLSAKSREDKQKTIDDKIQKLQDFDREVKTSLTKEKDEMVKDILQDIDKVISEYGKGEGYSIILNDRTLLYGDNQLNLTEQIIKILNDRYKKK